MLFLLNETNRTIGKNFNSKGILQEYQAVALSNKFLAASMVPNILYGLYGAFIVHSTFLYIGFFKTHKIEYAFHQGFIVLFFGIASLFMTRMDDGYRL